MILQALYDLYSRIELAPEGWEYKPIPFVIEITHSGHFIQLTDLRGPTGRAADSKPMLVPKAEIRSGPRAYERPNALWDHYGFVLGEPKGDGTQDRTMADHQFASFVRRVRELHAASPSSRGLDAICRFYDHMQHDAVRRDPLWPDCRRIPGCNMTFRVMGDTEPVLHHPEVQAALAASSARQAETGAVIGVCLVTGERSAIQNLHYPISGVAEKPVPLAAVNDGAFPSFSSFHKSQGQNFPVGEQAVFRYTTALNHLLRRESRNKLRIGSTVCVYWAQRADPFEDAFAAVFGERDALDAGAVRAVLEAVHTGRYSRAVEGNRFFVLGLAPNSARIVVQFWHAAPLAGTARAVGEWFDDLEICRGPNDPEFPSLYRLLSATAVQGKADNIPQRLEADVVRSILTSAPLPASFLNAVVQRCRAEHQVSYHRAASIKACLNRVARTARTSGAKVEKEIKPVLDTTNPSVAYRLGRLFAVLERAQEESSPGLNTTLRERYFGAASSNPVAVFTTLLRLKNHHLAKLENRGRAVNLERLIGEIMDGVDSFPLHLPLAEQGRFAIGYYHQRQAFFSKSTANDAQGDSK